MTMIIITLCEDISGDRIGVKLAPQLEKSEPSRYLAPQIKKVHFSGENAFIGKNVCVAGTPILTL